MADRSVKSNFGETSGLVRGRGELARVDLVTLLDLTKAEG